MFDWDENIFAFGNGGFKIKVFYVHCYPAFIRCGYGDVHISFDCGKFWFWCAVLYNILDMVAIYIPSYLLLQFLVWAEIECRIVYYDWLLVTGEWKIVCWCRSLCGAVLVVLVGLSHHCNNWYNSCRRGHVWGYNIPLWLRVKGSIIAKASAFFCGCSIFGCGSLVCCHLVNCVIFCIYWPCESSILPIDARMINPCRFFLNSEVS